MTGHHTEATDRPWWYEFFPGGKTLKSPPGWHLKSESVETLGDLGDDPSAKADAALIVEAVNSYDTYRDLEAAARKLTVHAFGQLEVRDFYALREALARLDAVRTDA